MHKRIVRTSRGPLETMSRNWIHQLQIIRAPKQCITTPLQEKKTAAGVHNGRAELTIRAEEMQNSKFLVSIRARCSKLTNLDQFSKSVRVWPAGQLNESKNGFRCSHYLQAFLSCSLSCKLARARRTPFCGYQEQQSKEYCLSTRLKSKGTTLIRNGNPSRLLCNNFATETW